MKLWNEGFIPFLRRDGAVRVDIFRSNREV